MQETLNNKKSHLVILLNLHEDEDMSSVIDVTVGLHSFEDDATNVICKSLCSLNQEQVSTLMFAINSKPQVVDLQDFSFWKDVVWDLIQAGLNCQLLNLSISEIKKLNMVGKFMQLHTLNLDFCSSLTNLEEHCFALMPNLRCLSLCGTRVSDLWTPSAVLSSLPSLMELRVHSCVSCKDARSCPALIIERRYLGDDKIQLTHFIEYLNSEPISGHHVSQQTTATGESLQLSPFGGSFTICEIQSTSQEIADDKADRTLNHPHQLNAQNLSSTAHPRQETLKIEVSQGKTNVPEVDDSPTSVLQWDSEEDLVVFETHISEHPSTVYSDEQCGDTMIASMPHLENMDNLPVKEEDTEVAKTILSKYYEYLPYNRQHKESIVNVLHMREAGASCMYPQNSSRTRLVPSCRKSQYFYTRSLCATKFGSSVRPLLHPITNICQANNEEGKRLRPRQFEYHPSNSSLMAVGTLDGEVVLLNHETGNIFACISSNWSTYSILGLCWLKTNPSKLLVGSDNGSLRLYDINHHPLEVDGYYNSNTVIFEDFEHLTSVHVNSIDDRFVTSGYSKKVAIYDICSGQRLQLFTDMHREPINVAKFANHSPNLLVTSSFDRDVKMWDLRQKPVKPCYTASSSRGNVMVCFSPDDLYLLVSAVDNEVKQLLAVDGTLHTNFDIGSTGSYNNYTRSYYMNGRDYIITGSCEEPVVRVCCAQTGRRLRNIHLEDSGLGSSIFVQSLRSDPFRASSFHC